MDSIGTGEWIAIVVVGCIIGLLLGYWLGSLTGRQNARDVQSSRKEQDAYRAEVREHFQEISTIMTRMAGDYREMYQHVAHHAEQLADVHPEHLIDLPPAPETITDQRTASEKAEHGSAKSAGTRESNVPGTTPEREKHGADAERQTKEKEEAEATIPGDDAARNREAAARSAASASTNGDQRSEDRR
ncbi:ZapG family protein [Kushneria phosphatilytica]|nr:DUF1043 family protein [Kushneria phosphatilytica]